VLVLALTVCAAQLLPATHAPSRAAGTTSITVATRAISHVATATVSQAGLGVSVRSAPAIPAIPVDTRTVIVRAKPGADVTALVGTTEPVNDNYVLRVPAGTSTAAYVAELTATGDFQYATPNAVSYPTSYTATPNDPDFNNKQVWSIADGATGADQSVPYAKSWWISGHGGLGNTASPDFDAVWPYLTSDGSTAAYHARATAEQVKVGVIDTGFYFDIPDAAANIVAGKDEFQSYTGSTNRFVTDYDVTPVPGGQSADHGTMVASQIAQTTNNGVGGAAAGYDTQVRIYKAQGIWVDGSPANQVVILNSAVTNAIYDATNDGCRVISMSLGGDGNDPAQQAAIDYAYSRGVVVVASAGNSGTGTVCYPAAANHVLGVGSYQLTGAGKGTPIRSSFSSWGSGLDIMAPGSNVWGPTESTPGTTGYRFWSGTSMAAPIAAAAAALTLRFVPSLGPDDVMGVLQASATDIGATGYDTSTGWGCLDMKAAYAKLRSDYPNLARPTLAGVVPGASYAMRGFALSWGTVPGYRVEYAVSRDGSAPATGSATAVQFTGLADGDHSVTITPTSARNWNADSSVTVTFTVDTVAPAAPALSWNAGTRKISWTTSESAGATQFSLDGTAGPATVTGRLATLPSGTADGLHTAYVRIVDPAGNVGAWGSLAFALDTVAPAAPAISWDAVKKTLSWTDPEAGQHRVHLGLDTRLSPLAVSGTSYRITSSTPDGPHTAWVRVTDASGNVGEWGGLDFVLDTTPPAVPIVSWDAARRTLSWTDGEAGATTDFAIDDTRAPRPILTSSWTPPESTAYGAHTAWVRRTDAAGNIGGWGSARFTLVDPRDLRSSSLGLTSASIINVAWGAKARLTGTLVGVDGPGVAGGHVVLEDSADQGATWAPVLTVETDAGGGWAAGLAPSRTRLFRASFAGDTTHTAAVSGTTVLLRQLIYLGTPATPSKVTHRHSFTTSVVTKPRFASGTRPVRVSFYRWEKHSGAYSWTLRKTVSATARNHYSYSRCGVTTSVPYSGRWKAVARYAGSAAYASTTSANRYFNAR
jgi:hypothetical protein